MIVYRAFCTITGKSYIGITTRTLEKRKNKHLQHANGKRPGHFYNAIRKHGFESFEFSILETCENIENLKRREQFYIELYDTKNNGYNMTLGGDGIFGYSLPESAKEKLRIINTGKRQSQESIAKRIKKIKGRKNSPDIIAKMRIAKSNIAQSTRDKLRQANLGKKASPQARENMRIAHERILNFNLIHEFREQGKSYRYIQQHIGMDQSQIRRRYLKWLALQTSNLKSLNTITPSDQSLQFAKAQ